MDTNNLPPPQAEPALGASDWRNQLHPDSRSRIVNKIMETLKRHLPFSGPEGLQQLQNIAIRFEEKIYIAATSQSEYLRRISLKMLTMEPKMQNTEPNALPSNSTGGLRRSPLDLAFTNSAAQTSNSGYRQEEVYQKIEAMETYFTDLNKIFRETSFELQQAGIGPS
ncbi:hypothetical protein Nepgr_021219 [Nepenthes gracilis]|uniref:Mediator complex subunit 15 KIX domain-containing protein n=1 Tax=Nepenthes gracilis TaxID=150966 RepID=A0AAD3XVX6_NEPGR|nr:hypothetical protein Nepgr_021219 [Nepenthes gracilis]